MPEPRITHLSAKDNPLLLRLRKRLGHPGAYRKQGDILIEGEHLCAAYLQRSIAPPSIALISQSAWSDPHYQTLLQAAASVMVLPEKLMSSISTLTAPEPIAFLLPLPQPRALDPTAPTIILDRLQDPGNVGAVLRSAAAFGFTQVLALQGSSALWSPKILRAAMGAHFALTLIEALCPADLHTLQLPLIATSSHAADALHAHTLPWPCAWVLGNEGQGISESLVQQCQLTLRILQPGGQESLNVAAAAAVCLYESARQRTIVSGPCSQ
jgi:RNA methyltransferase, TrmH family